MIVLLLLLLAFFGMTMGRSSSESSVTAVPATRVPDVTGVASPYAERRVRRAGLVPVQRRCGPGASVYAVSRQLPAAGTTVPRGTRVQVQLTAARGSGVRQVHCNAISGTRP